METSSVKTEEVKEVKRYWKVPYGAIFLCIIYLICCFLFAASTFTCSGDEDDVNECMHETWFSSYPLDFLIFTVTVLLSFHLWLVARNEVVCLAFSCLGFGFLVKGFVAKYAAQYGDDDVRQMPEFYIATIVYYAFWSISSIFFRSMIMNVVGCNFYQTISLYYNGITYIIRIYDILINNFDCWWCINRHNQLRESYFQNWSYKLACFLFYFSLYRWNDLG